MRFLDCPSKVLAAKVLYRTTDRYGSDLLRRETPKGLSRTDRISRGLCSPSTSSRSWALAAQRTHFLGCWVVCFLVGYRVVVVQRVGDGETMSSIKKVLVSALSARRTPESDWV